MPGRAAIYTYVRLNLVNSEDSFTFYCEELTKGVKEQVDSDPGWRDCVVKFV